MSYSQQTRFRSVKTQLDIFTEEIVTFGVSGDVAGILIQKLNSNEFSLISGSKNSSLKNTLSINSYSVQEKKDLDKEGINHIERIGSNYAISGNNTNEPNKSKIQSILSNSIIMLYIENSITRYCENLISNNLADNRIIENLKRHIDDVVNNVRGFIYGVNYDLDINHSTNTIQINLYEQLNKLLDRIIINVNEL